MTPGRDPAPVVAIDGPSGSGKSTVARRVAEALGVRHLDTGAMYRAVTWAALRDGVDPGDGPELGRLAAGLRLQVDDRVVVDGVDVTDAIRAADVTATVSAVSAHPQVREVMVERQRQWVGQGAGAVVEGRDIASVVLPQADAKAFLTASEEERARRRAAQTGAPAVAQVAADLARRDGLDSARAVSPLVVAPGAVVIDTTGRSIDEVVAEVLELL
ncbi:MAG TPA: (d)CMP kinase [Acidimicrobiales bacterium]|nr:(d)CMP kinase [Acidimicrobiales bacterium]